MMSQSVRSQKKLRKKKMTNLYENSNLEAKLFAVQIEARSQLSYMAMDELKGGVTRHITTIDFLVACGDDKIREAFSTGTGEDILKSLDVEEIIATDIFKNTLELTFSKCVEKQSVPCDTREERKKTRTAKA